MKALILGSGVSGMSAKNYLEKHGFDAEFAKQEDLNGTNEKLKDKNYLDRLFESLFFLVTSPGICQDNILIKEAKKRKIEVIGELELASLNLKGDVIAVTGTNGKTTTVCLINHLLSSQKRKVFLGGNIGTAVTSFCDETSSESISVLECSSFQLETIKRFKPHISAILNISEDHLNHHKKLQNYIKSKKKVAQNQQKDDFLLINADDELLLNNIPKTKAKIYYFSTKNKVEGCFVKSNCIYFNDNKSEKKLVSLKNIKLVGEHNLSNILCACLAVYLETNDASILKNISNFYAVRHRIEYIKTIDGVKYFNDSKATNIDSTLVAIKSFDQNINLILGGSDKGFDFDKLFQKLQKNVKFIALIGEMSLKIAKSAEKYNFKNYVFAGNLKNAVIVCKQNAKPNEIVLLSPACASFDQFKNFEERGNLFRKIVEETCQNENDFAKSKSQKQN